VPYRTPKHVQEKKDAKKQRILDQALPLFAEKGYENTSIQDICNAAGVSVGSLYFYFPNKELIFEKIFKRIARSYFSCQEKAVQDETDLRKIISKSMRAAVNWWKNANTHEGQFILNNRHLSDLQQKRDEFLNTMVTRFKALLDDAVNKGQLKPLNTELVSVMYIHGNYQLIRYWNLTGRKTSPEEFINFLIENSIRILGLDIQ